MPGRGDSFPNKIVDDFVRSTLALQFREVESTAVPVDALASMTIFSMDFYPVSHKLPLDRARAKVVKGLMPLEEIRPQVNVLPLSLERPAIQVPGFKDTELTVFREPMVGDIRAPWHRITFANVRRPFVMELRIPGLPQGKLRLLPIEKFKPVPWELDIPKIESRQKRHNFTSFTARSRVCPGKLFALPILRKSIPLNRFSPEQIQRFRKALADKVKTRYTNIELSVVYDRMHMMLFSSISPDKTGSLVCIPKSEYLGKNHPRWGHNPFGMQLALQHTRETAGPIPFYLVLGKRTDTGATVRTIVAMGSDDEGPPSPQRRQAAPNKQNKEGKQR